jgi:DNA ligase-1
MLAAAADLDKIRYPVMVSPKLDGIRAIVDRSKGLLSRRLLPIPNRHIQRVLGQSQYHGWDGELVVGQATSASCYRDTMSGLMSEDGEPRVTFWLFDRFDYPTEKFLRRHELLPPSTWRVSSGVWVGRLTHLMIHNEKELLSIEEEWLLQGYEGLMIRDPHGLYKFGRSTPREGGLLKLKRFDDSEALILGIVEQKHNGNEATINELGRTKRSSHKANMTLKGTTGALQVRDLKSGVEFEVGTGMDDGTRAMFWANPPIGKIIKYKSQTVGVKDKPRFPVFLGLRDEKDM